MKRTRPPRLLPTRRAAVLAVAVAWPLLTAVLAPAAPAGLPRSMEEVERITAVRHADPQEAPQTTAGAARAYLEAYPEGRYRDEALLALGEALEAAGQAEEALAAYERLAAQHPRSAFREYALSASVPLLRRQGRDEAAAERLDVLLHEYRHGLTRPRAVLWKSELLSGRGEHAAVIERLEPLAREDLSRPRLRAAYDRLLAVAYLESGREREARPYLERYADTEDDPARKAPVLMRLAARARAEERWADALSGYRQVVTEAPHPPVLDEARYWRAELFTRLRVENAPPEQQSARRAEAIALFAAYLEGGDREHRAEALRRQARLLADAGRSEEALAAYERLFELDDKYRNEPAIIYARARLLKQVGRDAEAVALLDEAGRNEAISPDQRQGLLLEEARVHYDNQECGKVLELLQPLPVFRTTEQRQRAMFMRGFCLYRAEQWDQASWDLEYLVNEPQYADAVWKPLARAYDRSGQYARVVRLVEPRFPGDGAALSPELHHVLAHAYERQEQPEKVLAVYERLGQSHPEARDTPEALHRLGRAHEALGHTGKAVARYEAALAAQQPGEPVHADYRDSLERLQGLYRGREAWEKWVALIERARAVLDDPADRDTLDAARRRAYTAWGRADLERGRFQAAAEHLERAWATPPEASEARLELLGLLARAHHQAGRHQQAVKRYEAELERADDGVYRLQVALALGHAYRRWAGSVEARTGMDEAAPLYERALQHLPPQEWETRYRILLKLEPHYRAEQRVATLLDHLRDMEPAITRTDFRRQVRRYRLELLQSWARNEARAGRDQAALERLRRAREQVAADDWETRVSLTLAMADVHGAAGRREQQVSLLEALAVQVPEGPARERLREARVRVHIDRGRQLAADEDYEAATEQLRQALELAADGPWGPRREATLAMVDVRAAQGDFEAQRKLLEPLLEQAPSDAERARVRLALADMHRRWGDALADGDRPDEAVAHYRAALERLGDADWRRRYRVARPLSRIYMEREDYRRVIALFESILPGVDDPALRPDVERFLGGVYREWGRFAYDARKYEFARRRWHTALAYLPASAWEARVAVAKELAGLYEEIEDAPGEAAKVYAGLVPTLPGGEPRRGFRLFLARYALDRLEDPDAAERWVEGLDAGDNSDASLRAGFIRGDIALARQESAKARRILQDLVKRGVAESPWRVPIHHQLAVLYHQQEDLRRALPHYRRVAGVKAGSLRERYAGSIAHAGEQVEEIEAYLKLTGGREVAAAGALEPPPVPPDKSEFAR